MNINTEASVKSSIQMLEDVAHSKKWIWHSYFNLRWNQECRTLSHCGFDGMNSFESMLACPYFDSKQLFHYEEEVDQYLENGYSLILPISTEKIGVLGKNFYHNIFVKSKCDEKHVYMYDFWAPTFRWKEKVWEKEKIIQGIHEIEERKQYAIALKNNGNRNDMQLTQHIESYIESYRSADQYTGMNVYDRIIEWIQSMESTYYLDHVVFVTIEEHFLIWKSIIGKESLECKLFQEAVAKAKALRNLSMKYWYSKKQYEEWKDELVDRTKEIQLFEKDIMNELMHNEACMDI